MNLFKSIFSVIATFMILFSIIYFITNFIIHLLLRKKDVIVFKRIFLSDIISIGISLFFIFNFITIYPK